MIESVNVPENCPIKALQSRKRKKQPDDANNSNQEAEVVKPEDSEKVVACMYCGKVENTINEMAEHCSLVHSAKPIKYKMVANNQYQKRRRRNELKCFYCSLIATPDILLVHHEEMHPEMPYKAFRFTCKKCSEIFDSLEQVKEHFSNHHTDSPLSYSDAFRTAGRSNSEKKGPSNMEQSFMCPKCRHTSNNINCVRDHIRSHARPYRCDHCQQCFSYPHLIVMHNDRDHPGLSPQYSKIQENFNLVSELCANILAMNKEGEYVPRVSKKNIREAGLKRESSGTLEEEPVKVLVTDKDAESDDDLLTVQKSIKNRKVRVQSQKSISPDCESTVKSTARKSTGFHEQKEFSYYGQKPDYGDLKTIFTSVDIAGTSVNMPVEQFATIINLYPELKVIDIAHNNPKLLKVSDSEQIDIDV